MDPRVGTGASSITACGRSISESFAAGSTTGIRAGNAGTAPAQREVDLVVIEQPGAGELVDLGRSESNVGAALEHVEMGKLVKNSAEKL
ncbi:MAG: hypothetical protein ACXW2I_20110 [Burkholderiales bacterium]